MILNSECQIEALMALPIEMLDKIYNDILQRLPSCAPIYLPTDRVSLVDRILGINHVCKIYQHDLDNVYRPRLRELRERYKSYNRCFLIGNGPSLNQTDLNALKGEITFAVNGFFLKARDLDWTPTFYLVEDHLVAEDRAHWLNALNGPIKLYPAYLGYVFPAAEDTIFYNHRPRKSFPHGFDFSLEADKVTYTGCTVTFSMMQIAAYLGFKEIYLIGVDASYVIPSDAQEGSGYSVGVIDMKTDDPNHFDPNYFGKGFRWHDPQVDKMIDAYAEARRVLAGTGQTIYNATVGGQLEIFERRSLKNLFPNVRTPIEMERANQGQQDFKYPRLLLIDMTAMGNGTATGEVKSALFSGWPTERLLQISSKGEGKLALTTLIDAVTSDSTLASADSVMEAIKHFNPEVILYRIAPRVPWLHELAMNVIQSLNRPLVTWLMDDWPEDLAHGGVEEWKVLSVDLALLLGRSALRLSICDAMSRAFEERYGMSFKAFANGVNPVEWPALPHHEGRRLLLRYSGGLAANMSLASVLRIARVVEFLANKGYDISFEINTHSWWYKQSKDLFAGFEHTDIQAIHRSSDEYRRWLSGADVVVIAYNHDKDTFRYVQYSMANKVPESLASGAVVFAHGPCKIATIAYLASIKAAVVVEEPSDDAVTYALVALLENPARRNALVRQARRIAFHRHNIIDHREDLRAHIASVVSSGLKAHNAIEHGPVPLGRSPTLLPVAEKLEILSWKKDPGISNRESQRLGEINRLMREGSYHAAMREYVLLWHSFGNSNNPIARYCAFNALYAGRKQGLGNFSTVQDLVDRCVADIVQYQ